MYLGTEQTTIQGPPLFFDEFRVASGTQLGELVGDSGNIQFPIEEIRNAVRNSSKKRVAAFNRLAARIFADITHITGK